MGKPGWMGYQTRSDANRFRKEADALDRRKRTRPRPEHPPQLTNNDAAEIKRLRNQIGELYSRVNKEIEQIKKRMEPFVRRAEERDIAENKDVWKSSTALRYIADAIEAHHDEEERKERERNAEYQRWWREHDPLGLVRTAEAWQSAFGVLGLPRSATPEQIKSRYRTLVKQHHPDVIGGDGARMREINDAYAALVRS
jgi:DnaJ-domain-containing protein 1